MPEVVKNDYGHSLDYVVNSVKDPAPWGARERENWISVIKKSGKKDAIRHIDYRDHGSFDNMIVDLGDNNSNATHYTVLIPDSVSITQNTITPHNISLKIVHNGRFVISTGVTLTINGNLYIENRRNVFTGAGSLVTNISSNPYHQIFDSTLSGVIVRTSELNAAWFGAIDCTDIAPADSSAAITRANRSAYHYALTHTDNRISQTVVVPNGTFYVGNTSIKLYQHHNFVGSGVYNTTFRKLAGTTGPLIECEKVEVTATYTIGTYYRSFRVLGIGGTYANPFDPSTYRGVDTTNHGIIFDWYQGADQIVIKDILIAFCGGNGLRIVEGAGIDDTQFVTMQHSVIENVKLTYCNNGAYIKGFVTDNSWIKCVFDPTDYDSGNVRALEIDYFNTKRFPWDNTFYSCSIQHADIGVHCDYTAWNAVFIGCHFEKNYMHHAYLNGGGAKMFSFSQCTFQDSANSIYLDSGTGATTKVGLYDCKWWVYNGGTVADHRFVKDLSGAAEIYVGPNQLVYYDTGMDQHIEVPTGKIHGYVNPIDKKMGVRVELLRADIIPDTFLDPDVATPTINPYIDHASTTQKLTLSSSSGTFSNYEIITGATSGVTAKVVNRPSSTVYWIVDATGSFTAGETITGGTSGVTGTFSAQTSTAITNLIGGFPGQSITIQARGAHVYRTGNLALNGYCFGTNGSVTLRLDSFSIWQEIARKEGGYTLSFPVVTNAVTIDFALVTHGRAFFSTTSAITINLYRGFSSGKIYYLQVEIGGSAPSSITWANVNAGGTITWDSAKGPPLLLQANTIYTFGFFKIGNNYYEISRSGVSDYIYLYGSESVNGSVRIGSTTTQKITQTRIAGVWTTIESMDI